MREQQPGVGRVVHYLSHGTPVRDDGTQQFEAACRAATITEVHWNDEVSLCVMNPTGIFFPPSVHHDEAQETTGSWHWAQPCLERGTFQLRPEDLRISTWREANPNSQCCVQVIHLPTGIQATREEKSHLTAKEAALDAVAKLVRLQRARELAEKLETGS